MGEVCSRSGGRRDKRGEWGILQSQLWARNLYVCPLLTQHFLSVCRVPCVVMEVSEINEKQCAPLPELLDKSGYKQVQ